MNILTVNLLLSTFVFWIAARIYVVPRLGQWGERSILVPILLLHSLRHLGLMFLAPGGVYPGMPAQFAYPAAYGDLLAAALAMAAILAGTPRWLVWVFNVVGTLDLLAAIALATTHAAAAFMGPAYWIPAFWVPALLATHYLVFVILTARSAGAEAPLAKRST
jgi:hypothetical protein